MPPKQVHNKKPKLLTETQALRQRLVKLASKAELPTALVKEAQNASAVNTIMQLKLEDHLITVPKGSATEDWPEWMLEFSKDTCPPHVFADAILEGQILPGTIVEGTEPNDINDSFVEAMDHFCDHTLADMGFSASPIRNYNALRNHKLRDPALRTKLASHRQTSYSNKSTNLIYCSKCMNFGASDPDKLRGCAIAKVKFYAYTKAEVQKNIESNNYLPWPDSDVKAYKNPVQGFLYAQEVYLHDKVCTGDPEEKVTYVMDPENGGSGVYVTSFPQDKVFRNVFSNLLERINKCQSLQEKGRPNGDTITNGYKNMEYPHDNRFQIPLPPPKTMKMYKSKLIIKDYLRAMRRYCICVLANMNATAEFDNAQLTKELVYPHPQPNKHNQPHLYIVQPNLVGGGHCLTNYLRQTFHCDINHHREKQEDGDTAEITPVSDNPALQGKTKPFAGIAALEGKRTICFPHSFNFPTRTRERTIKQDKMMLLSGDTVHAGIVYVDRRRPAGSSPHQSGPKIIKWYMSLHVECHSKHHDHKDNSFEVCYNPLLIDPRHYKDMQKCEGVPENTLPLLWPLLNQVASGGTDESRQMLDERMEVWAAEMEEWRNAGKVSQEEEEQQQSAEEEDEEEEDDKKEDEDYIP